MCTFSHLLFHYSGVFLIVCSIASVWSQVCLYCFAYSLRSLSCLACKQPLSNRCGSRLGLLHTVWMCYKKAVICPHNHNTTSDLLIGQLLQMRQADPGVVTALTHRPWSLSRYGDGTPRSLSAWTNYWLGVLDVLLDWAHHHLLWNLCGVSAILMQKDFISL